MDLIKTSRKVLEKIDGVKKASREWVTNYFHNENALGDWIRTKRFSQEKVNGTVFFYRLDDGFFHLYYVSPSYEELGRALRVLSGRPVILVADVITQKALSATALEVFQANGFYLYSTLVRMSKIPGLAEQSAVFDDEVRTAEKEDAQVIHKTLTGNFDPFAEQIPCAAEIETEIGKQNFLIAKKDLKLIGLLHYENVGRTSHLKRWFVEGNYRDLHVGSKLLKSYYAKSTKSTRFIVWVITSNENAIKRYSYFGYRENGLIDTIFTNKGHMRYGE